MTPLDPLACAVFLLVAFTLAGVAQTAWFASPVSRACALPLDGGVRLRGRRLFGANKTVRGFVVMVPAAAVAFALLGLIADGQSGIWRLHPPSYALLGAWAAIGFMAGELPNSFIKRQLDIPPGDAARSRTWTAVQFLGDRLDSGIGMLLSVSVAVPTPALTWLYVLLIGPVIHWTFSLVLFRLGLKGRAA